MSLAVVHQATSIASHCSSLVFHGIGGLLVGVVCAGMAALFFAGVIQISFAYHKHRASPPKFVAHEPFA